MPHLVLWPLDQASRIEINLPTIQKKSHLLLDESGCKNGYYEDLWIWGEEASGDKEESDDATEESDEGSGSGEESEGT